MLRRLSIFLIYCLFFLVILAVCLVLLFPRDKFLSWASELVERKLPGIECTVGGIRYVHPFKIRLYEILIKAEKHRVELPVETLLVSFKPHYPVERIGVVGVLSGGNLSFAVNFGKNERIEFEEFELSEMHLADFTMLERNIERPIQGMLSFSGRGSTKIENPVDLRFSGSVKIEQFSIPLRRPVLNENEVKFDSLTADVTMYGNILDLSVGRARGALLAGDFFGHIQGTDPWRQSRLAITGSLMVEEELLNKHPGLRYQLDGYYNRYNRNSIPYRVEGTIAEPQFQFGEPVN